MYLLTLNSWIWSSSWRRNVWQHDFNTNTTSFAGLWHLFWYVPLTLHALSTFSCTLPSSWWLPLTSRDLLDYNSSTTSIFFVTPSTLFSWSPLSVDFRWPTWLSPPFISLTPSTSFNFAWRQLHAHWPWLTIFDYLWLSLTIFDYLWLSLTFFDFLWLSPNSMTCFNFRLFDYWEFLLPSLDSFWLFVTSFDHVWLPTSSLFFSALFVDQCFPLSVCRLPFFFYPLWLYTYHSSNALMSLDSLCEQWCLVDLIDSLWASYHPYTSTSSASFLPSAPPRLLTLSHRYRLQHRRLLLIHPHQLSPTSWILLLLPIGRQVRSLSLPALSLRTSRWVLLQLLPNPSVFGPHCGWQRRFEVWDCFRRGAELKCMLLPVSSLYLFHIISQHLHLLSSSSSALSLLSPLSPLSPLHHRSSYL